MCKKIILLCVFALVVQSCAVMPKEHRQIRNDDFLNRFSKHLVTAKHSGKFGDSYLVLRKNGTFIYRNTVFGMFVNYYTGTYNFSGNALKLKYDNDSLSQIGDTLAIGYNEDGNTCFETDMYTLSVSDKNMYRVIVGL